MTSRRILLKGMVAAGGAYLASSALAGGTHLISSALKMPMHACDCHQHVIGPYSLYPMIDSRVYTPPTASVAELWAMHKSIGTSRSVLIQPSFYGEDNSCMVDALHQMGKSARGIAVIAPNVSSNQIDALRNAGVVGLRVNLTGRSHNLGDLQRAIHAASAQAAELGWHVEMFFPLPILASVIPTIESQAVSFVFDHFAGATAEGVNQEGFDKVLGLVGEGRAYVKLSAPYHSAEGPFFPGMGNIATSLVKKNSQQVLWGSDWPHPNHHVPLGSGKNAIAPFYPVDNQNLITQLFGWVPDEAIRRTILVDNPARLYGFAKS